MPRDDESELIRPPAFLRAKIAKVPVANPDALFEAVDKAIAAKADGFLEHARGELGAMRTALHQAVTVAEKRAESLDRIYGIAHDLKGQGSSFGYHLITAVAGLLCQFLRERRVNDAQGLRIAAAHLEALGLIMEHKITGQGGKLGTAMVDRLRKLVEIAETGGPIVSRET